MTLFREDLQEHLTASPIDAKARATYPGMAHFARTGPLGRTCRECIFFAHGTHEYRSKNGKFGGRIKPAPCKKYQAMMREPGAAVPDDADACKYFEENITPPPRFAK